MYFFYDQSGSPYALMYNGVTYYYILNGQGDVVRLVDSTGSVVASYEYDPYGKILSATGSMAEVNPLRYRGYYYDSETGFYYVNSRYYDPGVGRFLNGDTVSYLGVNGDLTSFNLFSYCGNNPVVRVDVGGYLWETVFDVITIGMSIADVANDPTNGWAWAGLAGDVIDLIPVVTGVGEAIKAIRTVDKIVDTVDDVGDAAKAVKYADEAAEAAKTLNVMDGVCFVAGTYVLSSLGHVVIEEIRAGDLVWAEDPETGEKSLKEVVQTFVRETKGLVHVSVNGEEIITTPEHPFYVPQKGWTEAVQLRAGDILVLQSGEYVVVELIQHEILEEPIVVYNFEVEGFHTYYVGRNGVLVHNSCSKKLTSPNQMQKLVERGLAPRTVVRIDNPKIPGQLPHIHFSDGTSLNIDGSVHDARNGVHKLTSVERKWLLDNGWGE